MQPVIHVAGSDPTLQFAAEELSRHLRRATGKPVPITGAQSNGQTMFRLGLCEDVGIGRPAGLKPGDDWICIRPEKNGGYILTGSNPRSALFAVYRYLRECGFRWLRPGKRGEVTPRLRSPIVKGVRVAEAASYRYRTICIEGAASEWHICDLIDWQAKHGMNGYFIQFHNGTIFFKRWYEHRGSPCLKPESFDQAVLEKAVERIIAEIRKRGLNFERMGHGWTCAALGISGESGWDKSDQQIIPADKIDWLAEVNGKKELWGGTALNTNLDYGNPVVRSAMTDAIVAYARQHSEVNLLHFWLADGMNNHDERPESQAARPSDFFVDMLNELDEKLTAAGLPTRIVFLIYVDLLWAPTRTRIKNQDRFTLMFAPITRTYRRSFIDPDPTDEKPVEYVRNKLQMPKSAAVNLKYLRNWQAQFHGDGFDFDYHMIWACYFDLSMFTIGRTLHRDIQGLGRIGLHGFNSCQVQRMSFPHNLLMDVMARTLWNKDLTFQQIVDETFADAFGRDGGKAAKIFSQISKLWLPFFEPVYIPAADPHRIAVGLRNLPRLRSLANQLRPMIKHNLARTNGAVQWSWRYLDQYADLLDLLLPAFEAYLKGEPDMRKKLDQAIHFIWKNEKLLHPALDAHMAAGVLQWRANELEAWLESNAKPMR